LLLRESRCSNNAHVKPITPAESHDSPRLGRLLGMPAANTATNQQIENWTEVELYFEQFECPRARRLVDTSGATEFQYIQSEKPFTLPLVGEPSRVDGYERSDQHLRILAS
jgi:hypothetical protein